jgi:hypothetical protein
MKKKRWTVWAECKLASHGWFGPKLVSEHDSLAGAFLTAAWMRFFGAGGNRRYAVKEV